MIRARRDPLILMEKYAASIKDVRAAAERIKGVGNRTPIRTCEALDEIAGRKLFFKCENFQKTGAFKLRGGWNARSMLSEEEARNGVCTYSSGNHAHAVALSAKKRGIPAYIVMPNNVTNVKLEAVKRHDANIVLCEPTLDSRESTLREVQKETKAYLVHPFNDPNVIAGQGTIALEMIEDLGTLDAVIAPIGGGGLMAGICIATRSLLPNAKLFGAEPAGADDAYHSLKEGRIVPQTDPDTICDGLLTSLGELTWNILKDHLKAIYRVTDDEIINAMKVVWEEMEIIIEPSCATAVAAVMSSEFKVLEGIERVGVILTGGNIEQSELPF